MGILPGTAVEKLAAGMLLLLGGSGGLGPGECQWRLWRWLSAVGGWDVSPWHPELSRAMRFPASVAVGGTRPACHVSVEKSCTLLQTF